MKFSVCSINNILVLILLVFFSWHLSQDCEVVPEGKKVMYVHPFYQDFDYAVTLPNGLKYYGDTREHFDRVWLSDGMVELETVEVLQALVEILRENKQEESLAFLDVGAHKGTITLQMAPLVDRIVAVEPFPPVLAQLYQNIRGNNLENVQVLEVGFGKEPGDLEFIIPPGGGHTLGTFSRDVFDQNPAFAELFKKQKQLRNIKLPIVRGDSLLKNEAISLIKIDIEGYERYGLEGMREILWANRPPVVFELNVNSDGGFTSKYELLKTFPDNYHFYLIAAGEGRYIEPFDFQFKAGEPLQIVALPNSLRENWDKVELPPRSSTSPRSKLEIVRG